MINNSEPGANPPVVNEFSIVITVIKVVILGIFLVPLARYTIVSKDTQHNISKELLQNDSLILDDDKHASTILSTNASDNDTVQSGRQAVWRITVKQPSCPRSYLTVILKDICYEIYVKNELCTPEDFLDENKHKIPRRHSAKNRSNKEPKVPTIINYAIGALLITSLGAALIEFYKAKKQPSRKGDKNPLSRKCSLADLTVMKHQRKEMVRRESILEEGYTQLGFKPAPLHRQCSFPAPLNTVDSTRHIPYIDGKPAAVIDRRRQSVIIDSKQNFVLTEGRRTSIQVDSRRMSVSEQDSPERRHHGRLVHRH